jgi:hypothetical protein
MKLDYAKTYDNINWQILLDILEKRGFGGKWMSWIKRILFRGSVELIINNMEGEFFQIRKGLKHGTLCPLSSLIWW